MLPPVCLPCWKSRERIVDIGIPICRFFTWKLRIYLRSGLLQHAQSPGMDSILQVRKENGLTNNNDLSLLYFWYRRWCVRLLVFVYFFILFSKTCALLSLLLSVLLIPGPGVSAWLVTHLQSPAPHSAASPAAGWGSLSRENSHHLTFTFQRNWTEKTFIQ